MSDKKIKELKKEQTRLSKEYSKKANSIDCTTVSYEEYCEQLKPISKKLAEIAHELQVLEPVEWDEIPDYGDLMTLEDWLECVKYGGFIDYDGFGRYSDGKRESNKEVRPSHVKKGRLLKNPEFTHIVWFNR